MNTHAQGAIRYILYARKSSESEDRQVQSIGDQLSRLTELARARSLHVVETLTESRSAKTPATRPEFARMLKMLSDGQADGILCWQINRLSRNPVDSGQISWMLQQGLIRSIITTERDHLPSDNALLLALESGMANQYVRELSQNVRRGMLSKLERGGWPWRAPTGYTNDKNTQSVVTDPVSFDLIRSAWDDALSGLYSVSETRRRLNARGYRSRVTLRRPNGTPMSIHGMFEVLRNPFYAGIVRGSGEERQGTHRAMVSITEFERVQEMLAPRRHGAKPESRGFILSRLFTCGECGCAITAEVKRKVLKSGRVLEFTYYHCTRRRARVACSQRKYLREGPLLARIATVLDGISIPAALVDLGFTMIRESVPARIERHGDAVDAQAETVEALRAKLTRLNQMYLAGMISDEEHTETRAEIQASITRARLRAETEASEAERLLNLKEQVRAFVDVGERFRRADSDQKRRILRTLGSNLQLLGGTPIIAAPKWLQAVRPAQCHQSIVSGAFEPHPGPAGKRKTALLGRRLPVGAPDGMKSGTFDGFARVRATRKATHTQSARQARRRRVR